LRKWFFGGNFFSKTAANTWQGPAGVVAFRQESTGRFASVLLPLGKRLYSRSDRAVSDYSGNEAYGFFISDQSIILHDPAILLLSTS